MKKVQTSPSSQATVKRGGSKYASFKNKSTTRMKLPIIKSRLRVGGNSLPLHLFQSSPIYYYWVEHGHRLVEKIDERAHPFFIVINRIRKESEEKYTSKLFL